MYKCVEFLHSAASVIWILLRFATILNKPWRLIYYYILMHFSPL